MTMWLQISQARFVDMITVLFVFIEVSDGSNFVAFIQADQLDTLRCPALFTDS